MKISEPFCEDVHRIALLFRETFARSEGATEGALIGQLARDLLQTTNSEDIFAFMSCDEDVVTGCIMFTRLVFTPDDQTVFLLSPVAVRTDCQRRGIGQHLISHGLTHLRLQSVDFVLTYGDPSYYSKTGFQRIDERVAQAPFPLTYPHGWLGQSLTDQPLTPLHGTSRCVPAFNNEVLW